MQELLPELTTMADAIYDKPEMAFQETFASTLLEDWLESRGFTVQRGLGSLNTAFRAEYNWGHDGPRIGLLCEYDALPNGHACGHQLQGPAILGAAAAIAHLFKEKDFTLIVYGTPAEEGKGGKVIMMKEGYLKDLDIALMMHGGPATQTDIKSMAKKLNALLMENAVLYHAPNCKPDREKTGSTDFANVMHEIPGACIRVAFVPEGSSSHSQEYLDWGKTPQAYRAIALGSQILAATVYDLLDDEEKFRAVHLTHALF